MSETNDTNDTNPTLPYTVKSNDELNGLRVEDDHDALVREDSPHARAVMAGFFEGSRLAFVRWCPVGTPWKDYDSFRDAAWEKSDSRRHILDPANTVGGAISRSMGTHWAAVAESAATAPRVPADVAEVIAEVAHIPQMSDEEWKSLDTPYLIAPPTKPISDSAAALCKLRLIAHELYNSNNRLREALARVAGERDALKAKADYCAVCGNTVVSPPCPMKDDEQSPCTWPAKCLQRVQAANARAEATKAELTAARAELAQLGKVEEECCCEANGWNSACGKSDHSEWLYRQIRVLNPAQEGGAE